MRTLSKENIAKFVISNPKYFDFMPQEIRGRLNINEPLSVKEIQKKYITDFYEPLTPQEIEKLTPLTLKAESELYPILNKVGINITKPMSWIVIKSKDGYDWNTCYTKDNVIIISENRINSDEKLTRTLAHEMIHIFQRQNPQIFKNFYKRKMNFTDFIPNEKQIESIDNLGLCDIYIKNPDICEMNLMVYNKKYLPIAVLLESEKKPMNIVLELKDDAVLWDKKFYELNSYHKPRLDQPNEIFAYMTTKNIS